MLKREVNLSHAEDVLVIAVAVVLAGIVGSSYGQACALLISGVEQCRAVLGWGLNSHACQTTLALSIGLGAIGDGQAIAGSDIALSNIVEVGLNSTLSSGYVASGGGISNCDSFTPCVRNENSSISAYRSRGN